MSVTQIKTTSNLRTWLAESMMALDEGLESIKLAETKIKAVRAMCHAVDSETRSQKVQHSIGQVVKPFGQTQITDD